MKQHILNFHYVMAKWPKFAALQHLHLDLKPFHMFTLVVLEEKSEWMEFIELICLDRDGQLWSAARYTDKSYDNHTWRNKVNLDYLVFLINNGAQLRAEIKELVLELKDKEKTLYGPDYFRFFDRFAIGRFIRRCYGSICNAVRRMRNIFRKPPISRAPTVFGEQHRGF